MAREEEVVYAGEACSGDGDRGRGACPSWCGGSDSPGVDMMGGERTGGSVSQA